jgi:hypothetical protein
MENSDNSFDLSGRPTFDEMLAWRDTLNGEWGELDEEMEQEEDLYFQIFDVESPQGRLSVKTGSAPSDADAAIDSLVPPDISVRVKPARGREKYRKQADKLVRLGKAFIFSWRRRKDVVRSISTDMVIRRLAVSRVMFDESLWPAKPFGLKSRGPQPVQREGESDDDFEERVEAWDDADEEDAWEVRHRRKNPIVFQRRSPRHVRWRENEDTGEFLVVVEHYPTTVIEVLATWADTPQAEQARHCVRGLEPNTPVFVDDIWVGRYRCFVINDEPLYPPYDGQDRGVQRHDYGEIPYVVMPFRELTFDEMERKYRGMLTNGAGLYQIESNVLTMQIWMLAINAWRTYLGWTKDGREIEIKPGQYIPMDERIGEYLKMLEGQPVPEELLKTNAVVDSYIQRNSVAQGPRTAEGTRSAQQLWAVQSMRTLKIESAKESMTRGLNRALELATMMVETNLKDKLTLPVPGKDKQGEDLGEVTVGPADIDGYWDGYEVSLGRRLDPALLEQWKALQSLATNKWMPERVSYELSGATDNPQEWIDQKVREAVDALPFVIEQVGLERVANWFGEDSERFIALSQKLQGQQQPQKSPMSPQGGTQQPPGMRGQGGGGSVGDSMAALMKPRGGGGGGRQGRQQQGQRPQRSVGQ